jgi:hypothetical protein
MPSISAQSDRILPSQHDAGQKAQEGLSRPAKTIKNLLHPLWACARLMPAKADAICREALRRRVSGG